MNEEKNKQKTELIVKTFALLAITWSTACILFYILPQNPAQIKTALMLYILTMGLPSIFLGPPIIGTAGQTIDYLIPMALYWLAVSMLSTEIYDRISRKKNRIETTATTLFIMLLMILIVLYVLVGMRIYTCRE